MRTCRLDSVGRRFDDRADLGAGEVASVVDDRRIDQLPGERPADEHDTAVVGAGESITACHEVLDSNSLDLGRFHPGRVRRPLSVRYEWATLVTMGATADSTDHGGDEKWYWDLQRKVAVPASQRRVASQMLGPYDSQAEAERWQETVDDRNEAWDDADDEWNDAWGRDDDGDGDG